MAKGNEELSERRTGDRRRESTPDTGLVWSAKFATGIRAIDSDHKNLFEEVQILRERLERGAEAKAIANAINSLERYCLDHFAREEQFMEKAHYPDFKTHCQDHKRFTKLVKQLGKIHEKTPEQIDPAKVLKFLSGWLSAHILGRDMEYVPYVVGEANGTIEVEQKQVISAPAMATITLTAPQSAMKVIEEFHTILVEGGKISEALVDVVEQLRKKRNKALKKDALKLFCKKESK